MEKKYYFAYGSNMNLEQMKYRCPAAEVVGRVTLKDHRLVFCGRSQDHGVASIVQEKGEEVEGLLWKITPQCEQSLDWYEGYPYFYKKQPVEVQTMEGKGVQAEVYIMNEPYRNYPAAPSTFYLKGILDGCRQNHIPQERVLQAVEKTKDEVQKDLKERGKKQSQRKISDR